MTPRNRGLKIRHFCPILPKNGHWEKKPYANCMTEIYLFSLDMTLLSLPEHSETIQVSHRHTLGSLQTLQKHPKAQDSGGFLLFANYLSDTYKDSRQPQKSTRLFQTPYICLLEQHNYRLRSLYFSSIFNASLKSLISTSTQELILLR